MLPFLPIMHNLKRFNLLRNDLIIGLLAFSVLHTEPFQKVGDSHSLLLLLLVIQIILLLTIGIIIYLRFLITAFLHLHYFINCDLRLLLSCRFFIKFDGISFQWRLQSLLHEFKGAPSIWRLLNLRHFWL